MRIFLYRDRRGTQHWGVLRPDGFRERLAGGLFSGLEPTGESADLAAWLAPVEAPPPAIIGIALNYRRHAAETGRPVPERPVLFMKNPASVQHPGEPIRLPASSTKVDYEGELAVIIGRTVRDVPVLTAMDCVLGLTVANDVSSRDWQFEWGGGQYVRGKSFDTFCPLGPFLLTGEDSPDPAELRLRTFLNGECVQESSTADLVFSVPELIAFASTDTTLLPGTVILTGTPEGVGHARQPPRYLRAGDSVAVEIETLGRLENPVAS